MAQKGRIKGITIEIDGDTTGLQLALSKVDSSLKNTQASLRDVNKLLKLDPKNTDLLKQKQELLKDAINTTKDRLEQLKNGYDNLKADSAEELKEKQNAVRREIIETEQSLKNLKEQYKDFGSVAKQQLSVVGDQIKDTGEKMQKVGGDLTMKLTAPLVALGTVGISYNAQMEQYSAMFTTLTGSAEEADRIISQLQADAQKSPFDSSALIQANQYLISAGVSADDARSDILNLGNAIAATGGGSAELERMAQNMQQIKNVGKATSQDIKQFANAGINIYGLLSEATGKSVEQVKEMDVTYEELSNAFALASQEGGKYYGAMEAQGETLNGSLSSTKESIQQLLGEITKAAMPIIVKVLGKIKEVIDWLNSLDDDQKKTILTIGAVLAALGPVITIIGTIVSGIGGLITALGAMLSPISLVVAAIAAAIAIGVALYKNWDTIIQKASELWSNLKSTFDNIGTAISRAMDAAKTTVSNAIEKIKGFFNFSWSLPKLKLPHISISGKFSINPPSAPKFSIDWYAKAMKNGMILNNPTIFGMMNGQLLGAGEAGSETIVGTNSLMNMIQNAVGSARPEINLNVYGSNMSANELADVVIGKLTNVIERNNQRW